MNIARSLLVVLLLALIPQAYAAELTLTSPDIEAGGASGTELVFKGFGCTGRYVATGSDW